MLPVFFGKLFGKKCTIQAGGMDCMNMPEIGYGNFRKKWLRKATVYSFKNCSLILPVAQALVQQEYHFDPSINSKQGLLNLIPNLKTPIKVVPNGFDTAFWKDLEKERKPFSFISVATGTSNPSRAIVKGYDLIEVLAKNHPEFTFTLAGDLGYQSTNSNIRVLGKVNPVELLELYNTHQFYLQLSTSEGFPNALGEAMSCGCIPIGSAVGAIPEIIGESGKTLPHKNTLELEQLVEELKNLPLDELSKSSRERILNRFSYEKRQQLLEASLGL